MMLEAAASHWSLSGRNGRATNRLLSGRSTAIAGDDSEMSFRQLRSLFTLASYQSTGVQDQQAGETNTTGLISAFHEDEAFHSLRMMLWGMW